LGGAVVRECQSSPEWRTATTTELSRSKQFRSHAPKAPIRSKYSIGKRPGGIEKSGGPGGTMDDGPGKAGKKIIDLTNCTGTFWARWAANAANYSLARGVATGKRRVFVDPGVEHPRRAKRGTRVDFCGPALRLHRRNERISGYDDRPAGWGGERLR